MQPTLSLATITDEEMKTGDPRETLRRASMQPAQIAEGAGITTRQQRKRVSSETHQGPGTPEVGDVCIYFVVFSTIPRHEPAHQILVNHREVSFQGPMYRLLERPLSEVGKAYPFAIICPIIFCLTVQESYQLLSTPHDPQRPASRT